MAAALRHCPPAQQPDYRPLAPKTTTPSHPVPDSASLNLRPDMIAANSIQLNKPIGPLRGVRHACFFNISFQSGQAVVGHCRSLVAIRRALRKTGLSETRHSRTGVGTTVMSQPRAKAWTDNPSGARILRAPNIQSNGKSGADLSSCVTSSRRPALRILLAKLFPRTQNVSWVVLRKLITS